MAPGLQVPGASCRRRMLPDFSARAKSHYAARKRFSAPRARRDRDATTADPYPNRWQGCGHATWRNSSPTSAMHTSLIHTFSRNRRAPGIPRRSNSKPRETGFGTLRNCPPSRARTKTPARAEHPGRGKPRHGSDGVSRANERGANQKGSGPWEEFALRAKKNR